VPIHFNHPDRSPTFVLLLSALVAAGPFLSVSMPVPGAVLELNARTNPRIAATPTEWENLGTTGGWLTRDPCCGSQDPAHLISSQGIAFYSGTGRLTSLGRVDQSQGGSGLLGEPQLFLDDFTVEIWARLVGPARAIEHQLFGIRSDANTQVFGIGLETNTDQILISAMTGADGPGTPLAPAMGTLPFPRDDSFHQVVITWNNANQTMKMWFDAGNQPIFDHHFQVNIGWNPGIPMTMISLFASSSLEPDKSFNGDVSLVRIYDIPLTIEQIESNFAAGPNSSLPIPLEPFHGFFFDFEQTNGTGTLDPAPTGDLGWFPTYTVSAVPLALGSEEGPDNTEHFLLGPATALREEVGYMHGVLAERETYKLQAHVQVGNLQGSSLLSPAPGYGIGASWGVIAQSRVVGPGVNTPIAVNEGDWVGLELVVTKVPGAADILQTNYQVENLPKIYGPKVPGEMRAGAWVLSCGGNGALDNFRGFGLGNRSDTDGDGLSDIWEEQFFNSPTAVSPLADADGDQSLNIEEFLADTIPINPSSVFRIAPVHGIEGRFVRFPASPKRTYWLEYMENGVNGDGTIAGNSWKLIGLGTAGRGALLSLSDPAPPESRNYRVRVE